MALDSVDQIDDVEQAQTSPTGLPTYLLNFAPDPAWYITSGPPSDYDAVRQLLGLDSSAWPDSTIQLLPYLPAALQEAMLRVPCDWTTLTAIQAQNLRMALIYHAAALMAPAADQARGTETTQGRLRVKLSVGKLAVSEEDLQGRADYYYDLACPNTVTPLKVVDAFERTTITRQSLFGRGRRRLF